MVQIEATAGGRQEPALSEPNQLASNNASSMSEADQLASARAAYLRDHGPVPRTLHGAERWTVARALKDEPSLLHFRHDGLERFQARSTVLSDGRLLVALSGRPKSPTPRIWFLVWGTPFGMSLRAVLETISGIRQVVVVPGDLDFEALKAGRIVLGFWRSGKLQEVLEYDFNRADHVKAFGEIVADVERGQEAISQTLHVFLDRQRVLDCSYGKLFAHWHTRLDWLQVGWVEACKKGYPALMHTCADLPGIAAEASGWRGLVDFPTLAELLRLSAITDPSERLRSLIDAFADPQLATGFVRDLQGAYKRRQEQSEVLQESMTGAVTRLQLVWGARSLHRSANDGGRRQVFTDGYSLLDGRFDIDFEHFDIERDEDAQEYWTALSFEPLFDAPLYLHPWDIPASLTDLETAWKAETVVAEPEMVEPSIRGLIAEAASLRRWTIPPRATVPMRVGPFVSVELTEIVDEVYFVWRTEAHRYWVTSVGVRECTFNSKFMVDPEDKGSAVDASMRLLMAALVRDFWVTEERQTVFSVSTQRHAAGRGGERAAPRVVYLPRVRYGYSGDGVVRLSLGLRVAERSRHYVRPFLRKAQPSAVQLEIAKRHRVELPAGHTWVQGHYRGGGEHQAVYRSRSAMNLLYEVLPPSIDEPSSTANWFDFERSVARLLEEHLGFSILDKAVRGRGDQGIDLLATKASGEKLEMWVVQCKYYADRNPVGPGVVRELMGAVAAVTSRSDGNPVRGLLVTSGRLSGDALKLCATHGIQSFDGSQLAAIGGAVNREFH